MRVEQKFTQQPFDEREVASFLLEVGSFARVEQLNQATELERDLMYTKLLGQILGETSLHCTDKPGSYLRLYRPAKNEQLFPVALKLFNIDSVNFKSINEKDLGKFSENQLLKVLHNRRYFQISYANSNDIDLSSLSVNELNFLLLAMIHKEYEQLFPEFVLPSYFLAVHASEAVIDQTVWEESFLKMLLPKYSDRMTSDGKVVLFKKGEPLFFQIQNLIDFESFGLFGGYKQLNEERKKNLGNFARKVQSVWLQYQLIPDLHMFNWNTTNLGFTDDDRLVIVDTNHMLRIRDIEEYGLYFERLEELAEL